MIARFHLYPFPFTESEKRFRMLYARLRGCSCSPMAGASACSERSLCTSGSCLPSGKDSRLCLHKQSLDLASRHIFIPVHKITSQMHKMPVAQLTFNLYASLPSPLILPGSPFLMPLFLFQPIPTSDQQVH